MRVLICGIEGYLGWSLAVHLSSLGHQVAGLDMGHRGRWVYEMGSQSAIPTFPMVQRCDAVGAAFGMRPTFYPCDMRDADGLVSVLRDFQPDAVVNLAEMPAAPWSMAHPAATQENNVIGSLNLLVAIHKTDPSVHLLKLGTMGEYGTPCIPIPEGVFTSKYTNEILGLPLGGHGLAGLQFPRDPGSFYHASKVADTVNTVLACKVWGLNATDVMQGVVYGTHIDAMGDDPRMATRFDFDESFGTAINRFCAQATAGLPITPYGKGEQKRGFLPLCDSIQCMTILLDNPPDGYRAVNQLDKVYSINFLANTVQSIAASKHDSMSRVVSITNPRKEAEEHTYDVDTSTLEGLGYEPESDIVGTVDRMLGDLAPHVDRIKECSDAITPRITWDK